MTDHPFGSAKLHHCGITVTDLDRSIRFYEEVCGAERDWETQSAGEEASRLTRVLGTDMRIVQMRLPSGGIELFEFRSPSGNPYEMWLNDVGSSHLCLQVDDIEVANDHLQRLGVKCWYPPQTVETGPTEGQRFLFFEDPDGYPIELLEIPNFEVSSV